MTNYTKGTWKICYDCGSIGGNGEEIAKVTMGEWGDSYASIRFTEDAILRNKVEAYIEKTPYGFIPLEEAKANLRLIAQAPIMYSLLEDYINKVIEGSYEYSPMVTKTLLLLKEINPDYKFHYSFPRK